MEEKERRGLLSRFFPRSAPADATGPYEELGSNGWADNHRHPVHSLVKNVLQNEACLIVTGYQDFLSSLAYLIENVDGLNDRPAESIRMVFGTNTDSSRRVGPSGRPVAEEARAHFLGSRGFSVEDLADLRAILAIDAIERGIISLRVFDPDIAQSVIGRRPPMLHAKLVIGGVHALSGSSNFSNGGLRRNLEFMDDAVTAPDLAVARREAAERYWAIGRDWTKDALQILQSLVRLVSPEEAVARTIIEATGFTPWIAGGETSAGRPPQPFQSDLIYEAAGTIHEHGFAFVEAPTGSGKTDIGKHLAALLPVAHDQTVFSWGERADQRRLGSLALIPASVYSNWTTNAPINFTPVKHSHLSKTKASENEELELINRAVRSAASMIVDESHRLSSRFLAPSNRSQVFERTPAIWTACLSATLMGNQGLDGLLAFHEKRASIYVPPVITNQINVHFNRVRERAALVTELAVQKRRIEERQRQADMFETESDLQGKIEVLERTVEESGLQLRTLQAELAEALAPYVVRRQRDCIGESARRDTGSFKYPTIKSERRDAELTSEQQEVITRIKDLAEAITTGITLVSADPQRAAQTEIKFHDKSRIHIRNFLALLRASIRFARIEWERERDTEADQRGRRSLGENLRLAERSSRRRQGIPDGAIPGEPSETDKSSETPICDRIGRLLNHASLDTIDTKRAQQMREILNKHGHAIFLAERVGVLEVYANLLGGHRGRGPEVFVVAPGAKIKVGKKLHHLRSGAEAQEYFGLNGKRSNPTAQRAMFLTFQMAEGINLQTASALGILGVTSDIKSLIQGLGRIDRIDSPHSTIHYFTFDLPGLVLSSDQKARGRVENIALLSGVGADELSSELVEFAAGDLTDLVLAQIRKPRTLRKNNYFDQLEALRRVVSDDVMCRVQATKPQGLWGAELCMLASPRPTTILMLGGRTGDLRHPHVQPPRLLLLKEDAEQAEISGDQADAARHLVQAFLETKRRGLHQTAPRLDQASDLLSRLTETLPNLTHWDIRPARTVSILASLARFISGAPVNDGGRAIFGDLTLPALEKLAEAWAHELDPSWIEAKQTISDKSAKGKTIPDYLGIVSIEEVFYAQPQSALDEIHARAQNLLEFCRSVSEGESTSVLDRVSTVFVGRPEP
ncbi:phospholipase D family protein [Roseovarius tibetensis]|uniref:phospholipase D family protein n=1 Tax=Roseovarius tibetensis TaxID=2685897 RepID=UPI003D7F2E1B